MPKPMPQPTRESVSFPTGLQIGRVGMITVRDQKKSESTVRYLAALDSDPIVIWERTGAGNICRVRVAGPVSASAWINTTVLNAEMRGQNPPAVVIAWDADAMVQNGDPWSDDYRAYAKFMKALTNFNTTEV